MKPFGCNFVLNVTNKNNPRQLIRFPGRVGPKDFKSWYSQFPCLMFSI